MRESTKTQRQLIQIRRQQAGMSHENHVDFMRISYGKGSTIELTHKQAADYLKHLEHLGYGSKRVPRKSTPSTNVASAGDLSQEDYIRMLWTKLGKAGKVREPDDKGLNKFIAAKIGVDHLTWCSSKQKTSVISMLRRWLNGGR